MTRRPLASAAALLAALAALALAAAAASAQAPAYRIDALTDTTAAPGSTMQYLMQVSNVGDVDPTAPADPTCDPNTPPLDPGCLVITASLPAGLTATGIDGGGFDSSHCTNLGTSGPIDVTCASATAPTTPATSDPTSFVVPTLTVDVDPSASGTLTSTFSASGGGTVVAATTARAVRITDTLPDFGVSAFDGQVSADEAGTTSFTQAGGHPYSASTAFDFNTITNPDPLIGPLWPVEPAKNVRVDLPPGFIGNPQVADTCTMADLANSEGTLPRSLCSPTSQVGTVLVRLKNLAILGGQHVRGPIPVYNMVAPANVPARFGFNFEGSVVTLDGELRSGGDYGLTVDAKNLPELSIAGTSVTFWGVPADPSHTHERACPGVATPWKGGPTCQSGAPLRAFLRNPTSCTPAGVGLPTTLHTDSWMHPGRVKADGSPDLSDPAWKSAQFITHNPPGYPFSPSDWGSQQGPANCERVPFDPKIAADPAPPARTSSPSGFTFDLTVPQSLDPNSIGESDLRSARVTLPEGMRVSASSADGLAACSPAQIALHSSAPPSCPGQSKIGTLSITTPLLADPLQGSVYLATPHDNPSGTLLAIYLVAKGPGVVVKLAGRVDPDPTTGRLTATFEDQPQLPFSKLHLVFSDGPRAPLVTPAVCGTYTTHAVLTSWSGKQVDATGDFVVDHGTDGGACAAPGFSPGFDAGTTDPVAGRHSSFVLTLTRGDADQEFGSVLVDMPRGLLAKIAGTPLCGDADAAHGTCSERSRIGDVTVAAGAGPNPFVIRTGRAYFTGPYRGGPFGLSIVVPAVAGPFDLGNVVVRAAIYLDRRTATLRVTSDTLPRILQGIPLDVRLVHVTVNKPNFIVNPTSCAEKRVAAAVTSVTGKVAHVSNRFQVGECARLPLAPKLSLTVGGRRHTRAGTTTPLTTTLRQTRGQAALRSVSVVLPTVLNARLPVLRRACSLSAFNAGHCTSRARVGSAVAVTPLLAAPLRGSAYFVKNPARVLPDLMVALRGQVAFDLVGKVSIPGGTHLATRFDAVPDVPITRFTLRLVSGGNSPLGNLVNLCSARARAARAALGFRGQNGKLVQVHQRLRIAGCPRRRR